MTDDRDAEPRADLDEPAASPDAGSTTPAAAVDVPDVPDVPEVRAAREALAALPDTPVHGHPAIFDEVQRLLTAALDPQGAGAPVAR